MSSTEDADFLALALAKFRQQKALAERAIAQIPDADLHRALGPDENSIAVAVQHVAGNQRSRWTDFLDTDGEKPDRARDGEFEEGDLPRPELLARWDAGWAALFAALEPLGPDDLARIVTIRGEGHSVLAAVVRQLDHYGYHVGQIVQLARHFAGERWTSLSIPRPGRR